MTVPAPAAASDGLALLLVGVGGQGVLTAAKILGAAAHASGREVVVGQLHGMSQRGGSVECTVLFGARESSMLLGDADVLVGFEPLELLRALPRVGARTRVLASTTTITPYALTSSGEPYPSVDEIFARVRAAAAELTRVDGPALLHQVGERRTLNVLMLGALAGTGALPIDEGALWEAAAGQLSARYRAANRAAFELGREAVTRRGRGDG